MTRTTPEGFHSVTPMCVFKDARKAIEFYKRAFGAEEIFAMPGADGKGGDARRGPYRRLDHHDG